MKSFFWGLLLLAFGIIATAVTGGHVIYYGAMIVGVVRIIIGLVREAE